MAVKNDRSIDHKCPHCGAKLPFNATLNKWKCDFCDGEFTLEELKEHLNNASNVAPKEEVTKKNEVKEEVKTTEEQKVNEEVSEQTNETGSEHPSEEVAEQANVNFFTYNCKDCGAEIVADEQTSATFCVYCGNTAILRNKLEGEFQPDFIIPFKKDKQVAIDAFKKLSKGRPFCPKEFNNEKNIEKIRGVYIPFWLYDIVVSGKIEADGKSERSWTSGDTVYTEIKYYKLHRDGSMKFIKVPADGSTRFDDDIMNTIEPFDYNDLVPYNHAYLSGFLAEKYDVIGDHMYSSAATRALRSATDVMLNKDSVGIHQKTVTTNELKATQEKRYYALLPVWMVNVKYNDKLYIFAMNGQTGEFIGDIPLDKKKVVIYTIVGVISVFLLLILIFFIIHLISGGGMQ